VPEWADCGTLADAGKSEVYEKGRLRLPAGFPAITAGHAKMTVQKPLLAIIGATASGKSSLAMMIARQCRAEILSIDSMQIYKGMDVGTAKPSLQEQQEIRHHLIDVATPDEVFSVARFVELSDTVIAERKSPLIATGGTPMYFKALFEGLFEGPGADESLRAKLRKMTGAQLHERLKQVDAAAAQRIHIGDDRRLVRALEVYELTGKPISEHQKQWESNQTARVPAVWVGLMWERDALNRQINARVKQMISAGWVEEVRSLLKNYPQLSKTAAEATGYAELIDYVQGRTDLDEAIEQIKIATRQLARRQMKWFRRFRNVHWLNGSEPIEQNAEKALQFWRAKETT
jgi:tRNA dimethylallyltransferase